MRVICAHGVRVERSTESKVNFIMKWHVSGLYKTVVKLFLVW